MAHENVPVLSVVIPVFDEEEALPGLREELTRALESLGRPWEVVAVDDGSRDGSFGALRRIHEADPRWRVLRLRRNFGQTAAFQAGFDAARGDWIVTIDADLQNDPADIGRLLEKAEEGFDIVSGWRRNRQEAFWSRRLPSLLANHLISATTRVRLHDYGCSLKVYRREVIRDVELYGELHRFIPALASVHGARTAEIAVNDRPRVHGTSKYGIGRTVKVIFDLLTVHFLLRYSTRPLLFFGLAGAASGLAGGLIGLYLTWLKLGLGEPIGHRPLLLLAVLLILLGVQVVGMGLLAELIMRSYFQGSGKRIYAVRTRLDPEGDAEETADDTPGRPRRDGPAPPHS